MRLTRIFLMTICLSVCIQASSAYKGNVEMWLTRLDSSLAHRHIYEREHIRHINGLKALMSHRAALQTQYDICRQIYLAYQSFQADSALMYAKKELELAGKMKSEIRTTQSKADIAYAYFFIGEFIDAYHYLNNLQGSALPKDMKTELYKTTYKLWYEISSISSEETQRNFQLKRNSYMDSLLVLLPRGSGEWWLLSAEKAQTGGKHKDALKNYMKALQDTTLDKHTLAKTFANISEVYSSLGEDEKSVISLIKSAIYDIESSTYELTALYNTALCIKDYDSKRASNYLSQAVSMLLAYNGKFRFLNTGGLVSQIYQERISAIDSRRKLLAIAVLLALATIAMAGVALYVIRKKNTRLDKVRMQLEEKVELLDKANTKLVESNNIKDTYLGQVFYDRVEYIEKLKHIFNKISRLLMAKKYNDIASAVSHDELDKERKGMYCKFDKTFLSLFPNFVTNFNAMFEEKDRRYPDDGNLLTNEMRIFAFIRLGVKESERIAKFLGYSVNTINTYKTRVKNRSVIPNDEFEERIMEIKD
jgi:hypothetical protein